MVEDVKDLAADIGAKDDQEKQITSEELKYVFKAGRDNFPAKVYYDDGNTDLYSDEALHAREALRSNINVK